MRRRSRLLRFAKWGGVVAGMLYLPGNMIRRALYVTSLLAAPMYLAVALADSWIDIWYEGRGIAVYHYYRPVGESTFRPKPVIPGLEYGVIQNSRAPRDTVGWVLDISAFWLLGLFGVCALISLVTRYRDRVSARSREGRSTGLKQRGDPPRASARAPILAFALAGFTVIAAIVAADCAIGALFGSARRSIEVYDGRLVATIPLAVGGADDHHVSGQEFGAWNWVLVSQNRSWQNNSLSGIEIYLSNWLVVGILAAWSISAICLGRFRTRRRPKPGQCPCGYDLTGNVSGTCPECGVEMQA